MLVVLYETLLYAQMYCGDGKYSASAVLWLQVPEASVRSLFHDPAGKLLKDML